MYKLFISHASEDKAVVARPLAELLIKNGLEVWFDEFELKLGDHLRKSIDMGLQNSDFGIVILSNHFFNKDWPKLELDSLLTLEMTYSRKIILPVWHNISLIDVVKYSPNLASKLAVSTKDGLDNVLNKILNALNLKQNKSISHYDLNMDKNIRLNWGIYNSKSKFTNIKLDEQSINPTWKLISEGSEFVGVNLLNLPSAGKISFEYQIHSVNPDHINIIFYLIPIKKQDMLVEVGYSHHGDPNNPYSFFRTRIRPKTILHKWITESFVYDYSDIRDLDYVVFGPRINEGAPFPSEGEVSIRNVKVEIVK